MSSDTYTHTHKVTMQAGSVVDGVIDRFVHNTEGDTAPYGGGYMRVRKPREPVKPVDPVATLMSRIDKLEHSVDYLAITAAKVKRLEEIVLQKFNLEDEDADLPELDQKLVARLSINARLDRVQKLLEESRVM